MRGGCARDSLPRLTSAPAAKPKRVGEDLASSEKPQSMRKGEKQQRSLEAEKKIAAERAAAKVALEKTGL